MTNGVGSTNISSALYNGVQGYNQGAEQVQQASLDIASSSARQKEGAANANAQQNSGQAQQTNINTSAVELISGTNQAEASAKVIKAADEMLGTIIDTFA